MPCLIAFMALPEKEHQTVTFPFNLDSQRMIATITHGGYESPCDLATDDSDCMRPCGPTERP